MPTYKFEQFNVEIKDPTISNYSPRYTIGSEFGSVTITLETANAKLYGVQLDGFPNTDNWTDKDVEDWVLEDLKKYEA